MFLGIDLGTQSAKVIVVNAAGEMLATNQVGYPIHRPHATWAEQHPHEWWSAVCTAVQGLPAHLRAAIQAIGLTGQMHGLVLLDENQDLLRPAIIWMDQRHSEAVEIPAHVGNRLASGFAGASLLWLKDHEPDLHQRIETILFPKDWLRFRLTGTLATELSDASGGLFLNVAQEAWSREALAAFGIIPAQLPHLMRPIALVGVLLPQIAKELGLPKEIPVGAGAADQAAMLLGSGVLKHGQGALTLGTGGQLSLVTQTPQTHPRLNLFCHAEKNHWYQMAALLAGGYALTWWQNILEADLPPLLEAAQQAAVGCEGLRFIPHLNGERYQAKRNAHFIGLSTRHNQAHLTRAILEGIAFTLRERLADFADPPQELVLGGGGANDPLWQEILASVLNLPLHLRPSPHASALGAAMLVAVGIGVFPNLETAVAAWVKTSQVIEPRSDWARDYAQLGQELRPDL